MSCCTLRTVGGCEVSLPIASYATLFGPGCANVTERQPKITEENRSDLP